MSMIKLIKGCVLPSQEKRTPEELKSIRTAEQVLEHDDLNSEKTNTNFLKKGFGKMTKKMSELTSSFTTDEAAFRDVIRDVYDPTKINTSISHDNTLLKSAYKTLGEDKVVKQKFLTWRTAKRLISNFERLGYDKLAIADTVEYKGQLLKDNNLTVDDFIKRIKDTYKIIGDEITQYAPMMETLKRLNDLAQRKIDKLNSKDPSLLKDLVGDITDPLSVMDSVIHKLVESKELGHGKYVENLFGVDIDTIIANPRYYDAAAHHIMNSYYNQAVLHDVVIKNNINNEFANEIIKGNFSFKNVDEEYIKQLDENHPLKDAYKSVITIINSSPINQKIFSNIHSEGQDLNTSLAAAVKLIATNSLTKNNPFLRNKRYLTIIKNNRETMPELNKLIDAQNFDLQKLSSELSELNKQTGNKISSNISGINDYLVMWSKADALKQELIKEKYTNIDGVLESIRTKYPGYSFVTKNGTKVMDVNGNFSDIETIKNRSFGHVIDITNPKLIMDDIVSIKNIQENGAGKLAELISTGEISLVPEKNVNFINKYKKTLADRGGFKQLGKLGSMFSKWTLFSPINYPGYLLTTQVFGNFGHTFMADPAAFKHWPKFAKEIKNAWKSDYHKIENEDMRKIIELLTGKEGTSLHQLSESEMNSIGDDLDNIGESFKKIEESSDTEESKTKQMKNVLKTYFKSTAKVSNIVEMVSRGSMAFEILNKQRTGKPLPSTANKYRVEHLWDFDPHTAAVRMANDTHIDYGNLPEWVRKWSQISPFMSFKVGSAQNMIRWYHNTYRAVADAIKGNGDWRTANTYLARGAVAIAWRAGVAALIWNTIMVATGALSEEERKDNNEKYSGSLFNTIANKFGLGLDTNVYLPGTGLKPIDSLLRIGKVNQKYDVFQSIEGMVYEPAKALSDNGVTGAADKMAGIFSEGLSPIFKTPVELALGGGTLRVDGYHAPSSESTATERLTSKIAAFIGASKLVTSVYDIALDRNTSIHSPEAYSVNKWGRRLTEQERSGQSGIEYDAKKIIANNMYRWNVEGTVEAIRQYEHILETTGKYSRQQINQKIRSAIQYHTLSNSVNRNPEFVSKLSVEERKDLQNSINKQQEFLNQIGWGQW